MEKFKSNVYGRLLVMGKILKFGDEISIPSAKFEKNKDLVDLIITKQLLRVN